jgi:hypothetical protein
MTLCRISMDIKQLRIEHNTPMVLLAITASRVQEDNFLLSLTSLLVEDLALSPKAMPRHKRNGQQCSRRHLLSFVLWSRASESIVEELQDTTPDVGPAGERVLL